MSYTDEQLQRIQDNARQRSSLGSQAAGIGPETKPAIENPVPDEPPNKDTTEQVTDTECYIRDIETEETERDLEAEGDLIETEGEIKSTANLKRDLREKKGEKREKESRTSSTETAFFQELFKMKFPEFVERAIEFNTNDYEERAYTYDPNEHHTPLWTFTRLVKSYFKAQNLVINAGQAFAEVDELIRWTKHFDILDDEEAYDEFESNWNKIQFYLGENALDRSIRQAEAYPLDPGSMALPRYKLFISMAGWLQVSAGDNYILLPCKNVTDAFIRHGIACNKMNVSRMCNRAIGAGYLREVKGHKFDPKDPQAERLATRFRFDLSHFPILKETVEAVESDE